jgi:hypothetical protein
MCVMARATRGRLTTNLFCVFFLSFFLLRADNERTVYKMIFQTKFVGSKTKSIINGQKKKRGEFKMKRELGWDGVRSHVWVSRRLYRLSNYI